jgi:acyl-CoA thioesterase
MSVSEQTPTDPQALAEAAAQALWARDRATQGLGMAIERIAPGQALLSMPVRLDMLNGHQICHGGFIFLLADSAFAFACRPGSSATCTCTCASTKARCSSVTCGAPRACRASDS